MIPDLKIGLNESSLKAIQIPCYSIQCDCGASNIIAQTETKILAPLHFLTTCNILYILVLIYNHLSHETTIYWKTKPILID